MIATEGLLRGEIAISEARVTAGIERLRSDTPLLMRNAVLGQLLAEKQRESKIFKVKADPLGCSSAPAQGGETGR